MYLCRKMLEQNVYDGFGQFLLIWLGHFLNADWGSENSCRSSILNVFYNRHSQIARQKCQSIAIYFSSLKYTYWNCHLHMQNSLLCARGAQLSVYLSVVTFRRDSH